MAIKRGNVYKFNRRPIYNHFGLIIFLLIIVYIGVNVYSYTSKTKLSLYEVISGSMSGNDTVTGIILRNEENVPAAHSGYPNFFVPEGGRVGKNDTVMSVDETGAVYAKLKDLSKENNITDITVSAIRNSLVNYRKDNTLSFSKTYTLKKALVDESHLLNSSSMLADVGEISATYGSSSTFHMYDSPCSGIVSYYTDNYENLTLDSITYQDFEKPADFSRNSVVSHELLEKDMTAYKIIPSENWSIVIPITDEQYLGLINESYINITFVDDGLMATAGIDVYRKADGCYAVLNLQRYCIRYLDKRFIDVKLDIESATGLKLPKSALLTKTFFKIPVELLLYGNNSATDNVSKLTYTEKGEIQYSKITVDIYYEDDKYAYISASDKIAAGDRLCYTDTDPNNSFVVADTVTMEGVYSANKGYALFRRVEIISENEEFCLVKPNSQFGISEYDHIISSSEKATENAVIY